MKSTFITAFYLIIVLVTSLMISCNKDDDNSKEIKIRIENNVSSGEWEVTNFNDSGTDETSHFSGYEFTFNINGTLTAANGIQTHTGTWNIRDDNSNDEMEDDLHFNINFNLTNDFEDLSEDWHFVTQSTTKIELIHESSGDVSTDYLTFEKQ